MPPLLAAVTTLAVVIGLGACSLSIGGQSHGDAAVELIEGSYAERFGLDLDDAECVEPDGEEIGTTFTCTADFDGATVAFEVVVDAEDHIVARSTNLVQVEAQQAIGDAIAATFDQQGVPGLVGDDLDCGDQPVVLDDQGVFLCALTVPDGLIYDTWVRITDLPTLTFDFEVAEVPRN